MRRFSATLRLDFQLQLRNGFYAATGFVLLCWAALLSQVPMANLAWLMPPLVLGNLVVNTFYFIGGLVLLEQAEGSLSARVVTPLRVGEYLGARMLSLGMLALAENLLLVLLFQRGDFRPLPVAAGIALSVPLFCLAGLITVLRYRSINEYLLPSALVTALLTAPVIAYIAGWKHWLVYLHPLEAPLRLIEGGFRPLAAWEWIYALVYAAIWSVLLALWAGRAFRRYVAE